MKIPFFSKKKQPETNSEVLEQFSNPKNYPAEVLEIHHEFEIASDKLVAQAMQIINLQPAVNESKLQRLSKFGFSQVKEIAEGQEVLKNTAMSREQIEMVKYYQQHYPFNKFITEAQVKEICHKYNLVFGEVGRFRGFVPDANLQHIENFKLKEEDDNRLKAGEIYSILEDGTLLNIKDLESAGYGIINRRAFDFCVSSYLKNNDYTYFGVSSVGASTTIPGYAKTFMHKEDSSTDRDIIQAIELNNNGFKICAPVKDMDISGLELLEGYKLQRKIEIPDPVILQPVKGGYLIVTAWGDEASDPIVVNQNFN